MRLAPKDRIIVALDLKDIDKAVKLVNLLSQHVGGFKFGLEFQTALWSSLITAESELQANFRLKKVRELFAAVASRLFWDGKFADIPNTVGGATRALAGIGVWAFSVHASIGMAALTEAVRHKRASLALASTVLSSLDEAETELTLGASCEAKVLQFARNAKLAGFDGIICSPRELSLFLAHRELEGLLKVAVGIRDEKRPTDDQQRTMTAGEAVSLGADYLVIGRPITGASDPVKAVWDFEGRISYALHNQSRVA